MRRIIAALLVAFVGTACTPKAKDDQGKVFRPVSIAKIRGLDPIYAEDRYASNEVMRVYEGLLTYHPFKRPYELEPLLAAEMPKISNGGLTYTVKLRQGVLFHDDPAFPDGKGREFVASDVDYHFRRIADIKTNSTSWWILDGRIKGLNEWREHTKKADKSDYSAPIAGIKILDKYTIQFHLVQPYPQFLNALAMPNMTIPAREGVEKYGKEFINHAVGTGPFILESFKPSEAVTYRKNPKYWEAHYPSSGSPGDKEQGYLDNAGKRLPLVDRVEMRVINEDQPRWLHFTKGDLDYASVPKDYFKQAIDVSSGTPKLTEEFAKKGITMELVTDLDLTYTAFNLENSEIPQFKDKRVRQAISLALDEDEAIPTFYNNMAVGAQTVIPPGIKGAADPSYKNPYRSGDLEKAKKLLAAAGFPGGKGFPVIQYDNLADTTSRQFAEYAAKSLAKIGLQIKVNSNTWPAFTERIQRRQTQMWGIAWGADYPDAENFLQLFYGPNAQPGGMNGSYYKDKAFDAMFEKARVMTDSPARTALYKQLALKLVEDVPVVLGVHRKALTLRQPWLKGLKYSTFHINPAKYVDIDTEVKKKYR